MSGYGPRSMARQTRLTVRLLGGAVAALALVAACTSPDPAGSDPAGANGNRAGEPVVDTGVRVATVPGLGKILVSSKGKPLYANDVDTARRLHCAGECATKWIPLEISGNAVAAKVPGVNGTFSIVERPNGTKQLALTGHPLYTFSEDKSAKEVSGNWATDTFHDKKFTWHVITATGALPTSTTMPSETSDPDD